MNSLKISAYSLQRWLHQPQKVFLACLGFLMLALVLNGSIFRLWSLDRDIKTIEKQILAIQSQIKLTDTEIKQAHDPSFIERQAREKMDLVGENDLLFVFPE